MEIRERNKGSLQITLKTHGRWKKRQKGTFWLYCFNKIAYFLTFLFIPNTFVYHINFIAFSRASTGINAAIVTYIKKKKNQINDQ